MSGEFSRHQVLAQRPEPPRLRPGVTLLAGCAGVALVVGSMVAFNTALGDIARATSASQTQLTWIVDGYTVALACMLLPAGAIGDRYGRRSALLGGLTVFGVASVAPAWIAGSRIAEISPNPARRLLR